MYIDDPIAHSLGITPSIDVKDYPTIKQLMDDHPPINTKEVRLRGWKCHEETKQKLRESMLKREQDPEWLARKPEMIAKMTASQKLRKSTPESRAKVSQTLKQRYSVNPPPKYSCPHCDRLIGGKGNLIHHIKRVHAHRPS